MMMLQPPNPEIMKLQNPPNSEMMSMMLKMKSSDPSEMLKSVMPNAPNKSGDQISRSGDQSSRSGDQISCDNCFNRLESLEKLVIARLDQQDAKLDEILKLVQK